MTVMAHEPQTHGSYLLEGFLALDTPEGFRAELIDGEIVVTPPPGGDHDKNIGRLVRQINQKSAARFDFWPNKGLITPSGARRPQSRVIPDGTFAPEELDLFDGEPWSPTAGVAMVLEVTSSRPDRDRGAKRHCYAQAGIPLYLLVDRTKQTVTLFSGPDDDDDYHQVVWVPFGKTIELPEPFGIELDTAEFA